MSKYSSDLIGLLRGAGLIASASVRTQERYLKHLWSHSSVREAIEHNVKQTSECTKKVLNNPSQELQNVNNLVKESIERSSVVVEGVRQYMTNGKVSAPVEFSDDSRSKSYSSIKNIQNLDIASITLKELENLLAEHQKIREVNLRIDEEDAAKSKKANKKKKMAAAAQELPKVEEIPKPAPSKAIIEDEKQVESMMKFITNFDRKPEEEKIVNNAPLPEVSQFLLPPTPNYKEIEKFKET